MEEPRLNDMMAAVGYLLLYWGQLECRLNGQPVPEKLNAVRQLRNSICHCLSSAHGEFGIEPFVVSRDRDGIETKHTWTEVNYAIRTLESFRGEVIAG